MEAPEPCPFCGSDLVDVAKGSLYKRPVYWLRCLVCHAYGPSGVRPDLATKRWNERAKGGQHDGD